jgi:hypothetical protein
MTQHTPFVPDDERAHGVGATGGLPGANADPRTAELAPEEIESTVAAGDPVGGDLTDLIDGEVEARPVVDDEGVDLTRGRD